MEKNVRAVAHYNATPQTDWRAAAPCALIPVTTVCQEKAMHSSTRLGLAAVIALVVGACATSPAPPATQRQPTDTMRDSLAGSELAFAKHSVEHGMRAAFLEYFADDGVNFSPGPGNTRARFRARPDAIEPFVLDWHPAIAAVSRAGDLGFTTGPYAITGRAPALREPAQGMFFSLWRRQSDGSWRVIVDGGVPTRATVPDAAFGDDPQPLLSIAKVAGAGGQKTLFDLEAQPLFGEPVAANGYAALLADEARLVIGPTPPALGRDAVVAQLAERDLKFRWETLAAGVSRSDDLGYSYGRLHLLGASGEASGYYVNVWMRDRGGHWRIVAELMLLPDPGKGSG
jgi:ketosteroid isomerase-like protein